MKVSDQHTAIIYDLNVIASLLGRYYSKKADTDVSLDNTLNEWTKKLISDIKHKPLTPKNDKHSISLLLKNVEGIQNQLSKKTIDRTLKKDISLFLENLQEKAGKIKNDDRLLVNPKEIEKSLGFLNLWEEANNSYKPELEKFNSFYIHPEITPQYNKVISVLEISRWLDYVRSEILKSKIHFKNLIIYKSSQYQKRYLMWSITNNSVEYCIPDFLTYSHFYSWDCPHNIAHLLHLSALAEKGSLAYFDLLKQRCYFESVAVYSEYIMFEYLLKNNRINGNKRLRDWLLVDRGYEFLLRLVRLIADLYSIQGVKFSKIVLLVIKLTKLKEEVVVNEINRYYAQIGLGSIYTLGYLKHEKLKRSFDETIFKKNNVVKTVW